MISSILRLFFPLFVCMILLLTSCAPATIPSAQIQVPDVTSIDTDHSSGFVLADGSRHLIFPKDLGAHEEFRTEWWYYTGNLETRQGRHLGFELTIFRVGLLPPTIVLPTDSKWYSHSLYFAHFAVSDIAGGQFYAFERYSRPGPGLAGAEGDPYHIWLEDWNITQSSHGVYRLQAEQGGIALDLTLSDEMGVVLHGENGYSRKGKNPTNASYYYSQPRLVADGFVQIQGDQYPVTGLAWNDHEFSSGILDENQIGWDWFSLQFEDGPALMLFQLRERGGNISDSASGTFISTNGTSQPLQKSDFDVAVLDQWRSPHTQELYPSSWEIHIPKLDCRLNIKPWMADQEISFPSVTYWEGAVHFEGTCNGNSARGNGYVELTGYAGNVPLP